MADGTQQKKRTGVTYNQVASLFQAKGVDAIAELNKEKGISRDTAKAAMRSLRGLGVNVAPLEAWYASVFGRSVTALGPGQERKIKVQKASRGGVFVRFAVNPEVYKPGQEVLLAGKDNGGYNLDP